MGIGGTTVAPTTSFEIVLVDPCTICSIDPADSTFIDSRPLFLWQDLSNVQFNFTQFTHTAMVDYLPTARIYCGPFTYTASSSITKENEEDSSSWLLVDDAGSKLKMNLTFLDAGIVDNDFTFTGSL